MTTDCFASDLLVSLVNELKIGRAAFWFLCAFVSGPGHDHAGCLVATAIDDHRIEHLCLPSCSHSSDRTGAGRMARHAQVAYRRRRLRRSILLLELLTAFSLF
jgi:hypothetical protein